MVYVALQVLLCRPLTLVMKGENIPAKSAWIGSPAVPWVHK
ncbi:hypothetical protein MSG76_19420 [Acinetobacter baumannii]|nr:hypothetical protein [Acinetobacter baumannii]MDV4262382.1 hypothetical protein [Acinetobacter baumannii]